MHIANESLHMSAAGLAFTAGQEGGIKLKSYVDGNGVATIGAGHTGKHVHLGQVITLEQGETLLAADMLEAERWVKHYVDVPLTQKRFDALTDFVFNEGAGHFYTSTLRALINTHGDAEAIEQAFGRWILIAGVKSEDLVRRRKAEADMFNAA